MAKFNWDDHSVVETPKFNWDDHVVINNTSSEPSIGEALLRGSAQGVSFGAAPAITGAIEAFPTALETVIGTKTPQQVLEAYRKARDESRANYEAAEKAHPYASFAGNLVGGIPLAAVTGGVSEEAAAAQGLSNLTKGVLGAKTAAGVLTGAGYGAASGAGHALSAGEGLEDTAKDIAGNAAGGAVIGGVFSKLAQKLEGAPDSLENIANERAVKSTGITTPKVRSLKRTDNKADMFQTAQGVATEGQNSIQEMGGLLRTKNAYQDSPVVTTLASGADIVERTNDLIPKVGKAIGETASILDKDFNNPELTSKFFNPTEAVKEIQSQLMPEMVNGSFTPAEQPLADQVQKIINTVKQYGDNPIPFAQAQKLKNSLTKLVNYNAEGSPNNQLLKEAGGIINSLIEGSLDSVAQASNKPELYEKFLQDKSLYKAAKIANESATGKEARNLVNRDFGLTDYIAGAAGVAAHGGAGAIPAMIGNKIAKTWGNPILSKTTGSLSDATGSINKFLSETAPEKLAQWSQQLATSDIPLAQPFSKILQEASQRDDIGRKALLFSALQNPSYRELVRKQFNIGSEK